MSTETSDTHMKRLFIEIKFHKSREITQGLVHTQELSLFTHTRFDPNTFEFFSVKIPNVKALLIWIICSQWVPSEWEYD